MSVLFDQLRAWWGAWFPSAVPVPALPDIPGRDELLMQLEERRKTHAQDRATCDDAIQALTRELSEAQQRVDLLQQQLTAHHREDWLANLQAGTDIEGLQARLGAKAPISLERFLEELDSELSRLRTMTPTIIPNGSDRDYVRMRKTLRYQTDSPSIRRRVVALQAARERAIAMRAESMTVQEISNEVVRLRQSFPEIVNEETRGALAAAVLG